MPGPASIACPHCHSNLKLKDRSKLGQKITCPKCKKPFKATEKIDDEDEFGALVAEDQEAEDEELPPPRQVATPKRPGASKGKAKGKPSGSKLPLIIGGLVALMVFVGVGLAIQHFMGGGEPAGPAANPGGGAPAVAEAGAPAVPQKKLDFAWLPPQADGVVYIRPADLLKSPFAQWVIDAAGGREQLQAGQEKMRQEVGVTFEDVESITIGMKDVGAFAGEAANLAPGGMPNPMQALSGLSRLREKEVIGVVRLSKPIDPAKLPKLQQEMDPVAYNKVTYYREKPKNGGEPADFTFFPSPTLVVISGREDVLKGAIDRQGKAEPRPELEIVDPDQHLAVAFMVKPDLLGGPPADDNPFVAFKKIQSACVGIKLTDGVSLSVRQACPDAKIAEEVQVASDGLVAQGRQKLGDMKGIMPENLGQLAQTLLASVKTSRRDRLVEVSAGLPANSRDNLKAMPGELMAMVMMGGLGGGGAGGAIGFNSVTASGDGDEFKGAPIEVEHLAGLPEGTRLQGRAGWSGIELSDPDGTPLPRLMELDVEYLGGAAARIVEYGELRLTRLDVEPAQRLKLAERPGSFGDEGPYQGFVEVKHEEFSSDHPADGARIRINFEHPARPVSKIVTAEGTVTLHVAAETKEILVANIINQAGQPASDANLQAAGFAVTVKSEDDQKQLAISFGKGAKVADVKLVAANGEALESSPFLFRIDMFGSPRFNVSFPAGSVPAGMAAKVVLHTKIESVAAPFRLENLAVPAPPALKGPPPLPWKLSSGKADLPEGLAVEGRLQWNKEMRFDADGKGKVELGIELQVDVTGPQAMQLVGVGFQKIDKAETNTGASLKTKRAERLFGGDASRQYVKPERNALLARHPPDGVRVTFAFEPAPAPFAKVDHVAGSLKLLTAKERKKTVFDKLATRIGKTLSNADFRAAGLELKLAQQGNQLTLQVAKGNPFSLGEASLIRNQPSENNFPSWSYDPGEKMAYLHFGDDKPTAKDALEVTIYSGLTEIAVPFAFDDLTLPPPPKPEKSN